MTPESPKGEPRPKTLEQRLAVENEELRSRLRTQRERLEKVRGEIAMEAEGFADGGADNAEFNAAMTATLRSWLAALDAILKEEGP